MDTEEKIDKVTVTNLDLSLRMVGIHLSKTTIDKIIDLVELIEEKGDNVSIKDITTLQKTWIDYEKTELKKAWQDAVFAANDLVNHNQSE